MVKIESCIYVKEFPLYSLVCITVRDLAKLLPNEIIYFNLRKNRHWQPVEAATRILMERYRGTAEIKVAAVKVIA